jgi:phospholipid/cholesterol/gamma-HCH transport system substrate-binding protein
METNANYVAVGAFVLFCVLGMLVALLWLAGAQYREEYAYYRTYFYGPVTGLGTGTAVRYNGIDVGRVSKLDFDPDDPKRVIVTLQISPSAPIHSDSLASIASEGLTGGSYVEIDGGSRNAPLLRDDRGNMGVIRSKPSTLQQLEQSAPQLVAKFNKIADRLNDVLNDKNRRAIGDTLQHLDDVTGALDRRSGDIDHIIANLATGTDRLNGDLSDLHNVLAGADQSTAKLNVVLDNLNSQLGAAEIGRLATDSRQLVQSLTSLTNQLENQPTRLLFGDRRKGYSPP